VHILVVPPKALLAVATSESVSAAAVAKYWGAGSDQVALPQAVLSGVVTAARCFIGGFLCRRFHPRVAYAGIGLILAVIAVAMGLASHGPMDYVVWSMIYALGVGLAYAAFTALVLDAMGPGSGATKYNIFASLSNFPMWWLGFCSDTSPKKAGVVVRPSCSLRERPWASRASSSSP
jgi:hypothetical protein